MKGTALGGSFLFCKAFSADVSGALLSEVASVTSVSGADVPGAAFSQAESRLRISSDADNNTMIFLIFIMFLFSSPFSGKRLFPLDFYSVQDSLNSDILVRQVHP